MEDPLEDKAPKPQPRQETQGVAVGVEPEPEPGNKGTSGLNIWTKEFLYFLSQFEQPFVLLINESHY